MNSKFASTRSVIDQFTVAILTLGLLVAMSACDSSDDVVETDAGNTSDIQIQDAVDADPVDADPVDTDPVDTDPADADDVLPVTTDTGPGGCDLTAVRDCCDEETDERIQTARCVPSANQHRCPAGTYITEPQTECGALQDSGSN